MFWASNFTLEIYLPQCINPVSSHVFFLVHQCTVSIKAILNDKKQGNVLVAKTVSVFIEVIKTVERLLIEKNIKIVKTTLMLSLSIFILYDVIYKVTNYKNIPFSLWIHTNLLYEICPEHCEYNNLAKVTTMQLMDN